MGSVGARRPRVVLYYQTFPEGGLGPDVLPPAGSGRAPSITHLHIAAVHFGVEADGQPYIHLNDRYPDAPCFAQVWADARAAAACGVGVRLMLGGAGGGFAALFEHYDACLGMLLGILKRHREVDGVELDVEELVALPDIVRLVHDLRAAAPALRITFAPIRASLAADAPGLGGFSYRDLWNELGGEIDAFTVQFYDTPQPSRHSYTHYDHACTDDGDDAGTDPLADAYDAVVANGYPASMMVVGRLAGQGLAPTESLREIQRRHDGECGGAAVWEAYDAAPSAAAWCADVASALDVPRSGSGGGYIPCTIL